MKRVLLSLGLIFFLTNYLMSQNIGILDLQGQDVTNDTVTINIQYPYEDLSEYFWIVNRTTADLDVKIKFNIIQLVRNTGYSFCWDNCYALPADGFISGAITIPAGDTNKTDFKVDYSPDGNTGTTIFRFAFFVEGQTDSSILVVKFVLPSTPVNDPQTQVAVYPNPAKNSFWVKLPAGQNIITLTDLSGKIILRKKSNREKIQLSAKPGLYILTIRNNNTLITRRVIVY